MRIASVQGRAVLVSPDGATAVDVAKASDGRFGPTPTAVFEEWSEFVPWAQAVTYDDGVPFVAAEADAPSPTPRQVFAIGLNYFEHAQEAGTHVPSSPAVFTKFVGSFAGPEGELSMPTETVDWEAELVVVIGKEARNVAKSDAWSYVAGLTVGQDFSERTLQLVGGIPQFSLGKSYVGYAPQGPFLVTVDEFDDPDDLAITCTIDGETMQSSRTSMMMFDVSALIEHLSSVLPLYPGDVIFTGTPEGVGLGRKPQRYLRDGEVVVTEIEGIGSLRQTCVAVN